MGQNDIGVLIIDDSAVVRETLSTLLKQERGIEVVATAPDPIIGEKKIDQFSPDVLILDIEMPRMDGLTFLKKLMPVNPIPTIICSGKTDEGGRSALRAMELGAVEIITKPKMGTREFLNESIIAISNAIRAAYAARKSTQRKAAQPALPRTVSPKLTADVIMPAPIKSLGGATEKILAVGASTGGTEALRVFLESMPLQCPGIVIVQHMPEHFTKSFADRLNELCTIKVKEAENGDVVAPGQALIANGGYHLLLKRDSRSYTVELKDGPLVCRHKPSVDVLFRSAARYGGKNVVGVILTGMGDDGARGMEEMKKAGAFNIAQDESSCVVFGMPKEAIARGSVDKVLPLDQIGAAALRKTLEGRS
ncbi:MAG: chemotaxis response regulator protein-glutamate methylesterase [Spirochaetales bacterium]|nr:chemotaxis response regulator protein-glutamate methylesterase [Spirochaetales bacterium]